MKLIVIAALAMAGCGAGPAGGEAKAETPAEAQDRADAQARPVQPKTPGRWVTPPEALTWHDAVAQAPAGCRLPARWELVKGFDDGEFERIATWSWTTSEIDGDSAWLVLQSNLMQLYPESKAAKVHKLTANFVVYLCGTP